jgi:hypothetical protein
MEAESGRIFPLFSTFELLPVLLLQASSYIRYQMF